MINRISLSELSRIIRKCGTTSGVFSEIGSMTPGILVISQLPVIDLILEFELIFST